jgi:hypothetical protein
LPLAASVLDQSVDRARRSQADPREPTS